MQGSFQNLNRDVADLNRKVDDVIGLTVSLDDCWKAELDIRDRRIAELSVELRSHQKDLAHFISGHFVPLLQTIFHSHPSSLCACYTQVLRSDVESPSSNPSSPSSYLPVPVRNGELHLQPNFVLHPLRRTRQRSIWRPSSGSGSGDSASESSPISVLSRSVIINDVDDSGVDADISESEDSEMPPPLGTQGVRIGSL